MKFVKMQGLGNDFVVVEGPFQPEPDFVEAICDRRFGIGADGLLVVRPGPPVQMQYWNADGSAAEMCGNGLRCVARYAFDQGWAKSDSFMVDTPIGERPVYRLSEEEWSAGLGEVSVGDRFDLVGHTFQTVAVGNPHAVTFVEDLGSAPVAEVGPKVSDHFPEGRNVEFARIEGPGRIGVRVWERGVGETLACGTGAVATVVAAETAGLGDHRATVTLPGGELEVELKDGFATITGPALYVFEGVWAGGL